MLISSLLLYSKTRRIRSKTLSPLFYFSTLTLPHLFTPSQSNGATSGKQERNHMPANSTCAPIGRTRYDSKSVGKKTNDAIFPREMSPEMASFIRRLKEEGCLKDGDFNYEKPVLCNSYSLNLLKSATEQLGLKHQPIAKWLSGGELKQVALFGCPSVERRTVMAAKCLRSFFRIEENTVHLHMEIMLNASDQLFWTLKTVILIHSTDQYALCIVPYPHLYKYIIQKCVQGKSKIGPLTILLALNCLLNYCICIIKPLIWKFNNADWGNDMFFVWRQFVNRELMSVSNDVVCESCKVKTSCRFANQRVERQEKVILTYVTRLLVLYALDAIPQELSISENLKLSINKLLNEVINLST